MRHALQSSWTLTVIAGQQMMILRSSFWAAGRASPRPAFVAVRDNSGDGWL